MNPEIGAIPIAVFDEIGWITLFLTIPAAPEIVNAFLIPGGTDNPQSMEVHWALNDICWTGLLPIVEDGVALQQAVPEQEVLIFLRFNAAKKSASDIKNT